MPDYGHEIRFGVFLTPTARTADDVVAVAVHAEELGYDLVTFQDHPYQPRFLDAWTLLSFVAARTSRIRLAPNVLNLPLRPPAVLARAAASLDLLTGGRVELALGAGAFWEAIEAMGGRHLPPAQAVEALSEAIDVVRALWTVEGSGPLVVPGSHYGLRGAKRGPAPAHPMEIWVGAAKPRMLSVIGQKGDGWLPSLGRVSFADLAEGNAIIDAAARRHGRDPRAIRRLLNIGGPFAGPVGRSPTPGEREGARGESGRRADHRVTELVTLAVRDGISTFIMASDDADVLATFASDVAPAVRAEVTGRRSSVGRARPPGDPPGRVG